MGLLGASAPLLLLTIVAIRTEGTDRVWPLQGLLETGLEAGLECHAYIETCTALWWVGLSILVAEFLR